MALLDPQARPCPAKARRWAPSRRSSRPADSWACPTSVRSLDASTLPDGSAMATKRRSRFLTRLRTTPCRLRSAPAAAKPWFATRGWRVAATACAVIVEGRLLRFGKLALVVGLRGREGLRGGLLELGVLRSGAGARDGGRDRPDQENGGQPDGPVEHGRRRLPLLGQDFCRSFLRGSMGFMTGPGGTLFQIMRDRRLDSFGGRPCHRGEQAHGGHYDKPQFLDKAPFPSCRPRSGRARIGGRSRGRRRGTTGRSPEKGWSTTPPRRRGPHPPRRTPGMLRRLRETSTRMPAAPIESATAALTWLVTAPTSTRTARKGAIPFITSRMPATPSVWAAWPRKGVRRSRNDR